MPRGRDAVARSGLAQWLAGESYQFDPPVRPTEYVDAYGNLCQRLEIAPGPMCIRWSAIVETDEFIAVAPNAPATPVSDLPADILQSIRQSRYCPSDKMSEQAHQIAGSLTPGYAQVGMPSLRLTSMAAGIPLTGHKTNRAGDASW